MLQLMLASTLLGRDDRRAALLFATVTAKHDVREAWLGLATARYRLDDAAGAAEALGAALRRHVIDPNYSGLADAIARAAGAAGWSGITSDGQVISTARGRAEAVIGFPPDRSAITAVAGCVSAKDGGLAGWAWHPGNPDLDPIITIRPPTGRKSLVITATDHDHGIKIESLHINQKLEKGKPTAIEFTPTEPGTFPFECSHFCGLGHKKMKGELIVE